jgi:hypothetical protein
VRLVLHRHTASAAVATASSIVGTLSRHRADDERVDAARATFHIPIAAPLFLASLKKLTLVMQMLLFFLSTLHAPSFRKSFMRFRSLYRRNFTSRAARSAFRPSIDRLESRLALTIDTLSIGGSQFGSFTDADGDTVNVFITGTSGTAVFRNASNQPVSDGDDIAFVTITGASGNFDLSFTAGAVAGSGGIAVGAISAAGTIGGIFTVTDATDTAVFNLTSFTGTTFSSSGGIFIDNVVDGGSIVLSSGLPARTTIDVRGNLGEGASIVTGTSSRSPLAGRIYFNASSVDSFVVLNGAATSEFGLTNQSGGDPVVDSLASITFNGLFNGVATVTQNDAGTLSFNGGIGRQGTVNYDGDAFSVGGDVAGSVLFRSGLQTGTITGSLKKTARMYFNRPVDVTVNGNVDRGAIIVADDNANLTVNGSFNGQLALGDAGSDSTLTVGRSMTGGSIVGDTPLSLSVGGSITKSTFIDIGRDLFLNVAGSVTGSSRITALNTVTAVIGGDFKDGRIQSASRDFDSPGLDLEVAGSVSNVRLLTNNALSIAIGGSVTKSRITAISGGVTGTVGGRITTSRIAAQDDSVSLTVSGDLLDSVLTADSTSTLDIGGNYRSSFFGANPLDFSADGSMLKGSSIVLESTLNLVVNGNVSGTINVFNSRNFLVGGNVTKDARLALRVVGQGLGTLAIGGTFAGRLDLERLYGTQSAGVRTLVAGDVLSSAQISIGSLLEFDSGESIAFGGNMLGQLSIAQNLPVDLSIAGNANAITIGGVVNGNVAVTGALTSLVSGGSFFLYNSPTSGQFYVNAGDPRGTLTVGSFRRGAATVRPVVPVP